jgi:hypothetical protein
MKRDMTKEEEEQFMKDNMAKVFHFCHELRDRKITRTDCLQRLLTDCKLALHACSSSHR